MSAPMDVQPEQQEVFYTDEKLQKEAPELPDPTGRRQRLQANFVLNWQQSWPGIQQQWQTTSS